MGMVGKKESVGILDFLVETWNESQYWKFRILHLICRVNGKISFFS